jgi:ribonucleoside-triphosphate reductase
MEGSRHAGTHTKAKRSVETFRSEKITWAIFKAATAVGGNDWSRAEELTRQVVDIAQKQFVDGIADVEQIQDIVEKVLIENGHARTAKAYILYREKRKGAREMNALIAPPSACSPIICRTGTG